MNTLLNFIIGQGVTEEIGKLRSDKEESAQIRKPASVPLALLCMAQFSFGVHRGWTL